VSAQTFAGFIEVTIRWPAIATLLTGP